jgi:hypothetical protein
MALAWIQYSTKNGQPVFEVDTGSNRFFELFLTTRPELMQPQFARNRSQDNFYSSREALGKLLPSSEGKALFPLPQIVRQLFPDGKVYFMVKTFRDEQGNGPALSPVMQGNESRVMMPPVDPREESMQVFDQEARLAQLSWSASRLAQARRPTALSQPTRRANRTPGGSTRGGDLATGLALVCDRLHALSVEDPAFPHPPRYEDIVRIMTYVLSEIPAPGSRASATSALNGQIRGLSRSAVSQRELERSVLDAHRRLRRAGFRRSRETMAPLLAALIPMLVQMLPQLLPMLSQLLGGLVRGASAEQSLVRTTEAPASAAPAAAGTGAAAGANVQAQLAQLLAAAAQPSSAAAAATPTTPAPAPAVPTAPVAQAKAGAAVSPQQAAALLSALQGAGAGAGGGGGGLGSLLGVLGGMGGPAGLGSMGGAGILQSVVDRLPIQKMFDGTVWVPTVDQGGFDRLVQSLPWSEILSLSEPTSVIGAVFVPGRRFLESLRGVKLSLVNRSPLKLNDGRESWIFLADRPARLHLEIVAQSGGLQRPFVDVRVSRDGTPQSGIHRSVFRLPSMAPGERRVADVEISPEILARASTDGQQTCISLRVIEYKDEAYRAAETRACCYVVQPNNLVLEPGAALREAPELDTLSGLEQRLPQAVLGPELRIVNWLVEAVPGQTLAPNGRYLPVRQRVAGEEVVLEGGLQFSPIGLADLARWAPDNALGAEALGALASAIDHSAALRDRISLRLQEVVEPQVLTRAADTGKGLAIRVDMGWLPAYLVSFAGANPDGNPTRRQVRPVSLPVPRGITIKPA